MLAMSLEGQREVDRLYHLARERSGLERDALLSQADPEVRAEVESLLAQHSAYSPGSMLGPYKIEALVGQGGMGKVFCAVDTRLDRRVAIKVASQHFSERSSREARAISALNHPHICTLYDVGPDYLVMEYVEGETVQDRIRKGALPLALTLTYGTQIADALCEAHPKGITHRDLKPGNVMISKNGVKVLDFGLAKFAALDETQTQAGVVVGTPLYMAPEQRDGRSADARTDIYALGLLLYEMATCKRFLQGQSLQLQEFPRKICAYRLSAA